MDGNINNEYVPLHNSETIAPVLNTGGGSGGGGQGGDLGFFRNTIKSIFNRSPYKSLGKLMLAMAFNSF
jgi:hypothetical protein